ncbi:MULTISPECIES: DUF350 domain-containing protein [unclassified Paenibacillus]|uniref:DUF350 domain-containing protein n=1 Tax=unclassified Paenibacillus TaxID=185978 RepID=UPI0009562B0F|nr:MULTISPECIES: DUF350 domain-containing protein [unclassified Paenibacillus]ASS68932.1 DUF350 domain-containing protein [Paenibacillus sp. RUD330]SIR14381.1 putative membrane protein [Paenibacillus sp. RU4X]SIR23559.1 putative membrane protein [Paenibacillus sp. RU4T]
MDRIVDGLLRNEYFSSLIYVSIAIMALILFLSLFEWVAKYKCWDEIRKGNMAVAFATGGKIFGICNIFRFSANAGDSIYAGLLWGAYGFIILLLAYFLFEFLTPVFRIDEEIRKDNRAVGFIAMVISVSISFVIGGTI